MKKLFIFCLCLQLLPFVARAQGVTDFVIDPVTGYTISTPGSYRLAADVVMTADVAAVTVSADHVKIDLNSHSLTGAAGATANGISADTSAYFAVRNGDVIGFSTGVHCTGSNATAENVTAIGCSMGGIAFQGSGARLLHSAARDNGGWGLNVGINAMVEGCSAVANNKTGNTGGIQIGNLSAIRDCIANQNTPTSGDSSATAIQTGTNCTVVNCTAASNASFGTGSTIGILASDQCVLSGNAASANSSGGGSVTGIKVTVGSQIFNNVCSFNRVGTGSSGTATGITAQQDCLIENNICADNSSGSANGSARGITCSSDCVVRGNTAVNNDAAGTGTAYGILINGPCLVEGNSCSSHNGAAASWGIFVQSNSGVVRGNATSANETGGIRLNTAATAENAVRAERNRCAEFLGFSATAGHSLGTGEDANINY